MSRLGFDAENENTVLMVEKLAQSGSFLFYGSFGAGTVVAFVVLLFMLYMLFRPDPYKDQKTYSKRSVQSAS